MAIVRVGNLGALATAAAATATVSPAFGQATTAGNLLIAWVARRGATGWTVGAATGWTQAVMGGGTGDNAIFYKANCGANETAPTFTSTGTSGTLWAMLAEFSGAATVSVLDQIGTAAGSAAQTVTCAAPDTAGGALQVVSASGGGGGQTVTFSDTYGSNATAIVASRTPAATATAEGYSFTYAITQNNSVADSDTFSSFTTWTTSMAAASFKAIPPYLPQGLFSSIGHPGPRPGI
jgi:hypothetical protein